MNHTPHDNQIRQETSLAPGGRPRLLGAALVIGGILAVSVALAGCGGGGPSTPGVATGATGSTTVNSSTGGSSKATGLVAYAACMRSHGVPNFPDPSSGGGIPKDAVVSAFQAVGNSQAEAATSACRDLLPAGGSLSGQAVQTITAQDRQDYLRAAACMRSHGFPDFPDPAFPHNGVHVNIPSSINQNSSEFTSAALVCTRLIRAGLPGTHPGNP